MQGIEHGFDPLAADVIADGCIVPPAISSNVIVIGGVQYLTIDASVMSRAVLEKFGFELLCMTIPFAFGE